MKTITTKIKFLDSNSKEMVSRKLRDACESIINEFNENETSISPILKIGKYPDGSWDIHIKDSMTSVKEINLYNYSNEEGVLNFNKLLKDSYSFLKDEDEKISEENIVNKNNKEESDDEEIKTYRDYLEEKLELVKNSDFRHYLIKIILGEDKGWSYLKLPNNIEGNDFDVVTPKNAKKIAKSFSGSNK